MKRENIAAQLYTLREFCKTPEDLAQTLKKVRAIGYEAVQVSGVGPIDPAVVKQLADENGLKIVATHVSYDRMKDDFDRLVAEHKLWDCKYIGIGSIPASYRGSYEGYSNFALEASVVSRKLKEAGLQFIYHNHKFEFEKYNGKPALQILLDESDPDSFGFEIDTYWVHAGGGSAAEWVRKVKGRMGAVHLKDMAIVEDKQVYAEIGEGNMPWAEIIAACREIGVEWYIVEQDTCLRDPFESLAISFNNLQKFL
ncbi:sugar phosphate isomerase/epimerase family protein [Paenibacillus koleovorans]|uniref:sugar phosphate isomerase/epimerase family protein n=1 Tax=Paenibacillus koleovorans TaxID=121608 RepID=UPI000FD7D9EC|nr:sugar phosphate isomerase/epimerase [Paenibacillus koleovorans]